MICLMKSLLSLGRLECTCYKYLLETIKQGPGPGGLKFLIYCVNLHARIPSININGMLWIDAMNHERDDAEGEK